MHTEVQYKQNSTEQMSELQHNSLLYNDEQWKYKQNNKKLTVIPLIIYEY